MSAPDSKYNHLLHAEAIYFSTVETDSLVVYISGQKADKNHVFESILHFEFAKYEEWPHRLE